MLICLHPWQTPLLLSRMVGQRDSETIVMWKRRDVVALLCSAQSAINRWIRSECHANVPYLNFQSDSQSHINAAGVKHSTLPAKKANSHTHLYPTRRRLLCMAVDKVTHLHIIIMLSVLWTIHPPTLRIERVKLHSLTTFEDWQNDDLGFYFIIEPSSSSSLGLGIDRHAEQSIEAAF